MANISVQITDNSDMIKQAEAAAIERALEKIGITAEAYAKMLCTVDTGRLRNSITHATSTNRGQDAYADNNGQEYTGGAAKGTPEKKTVYIGSNVEYAPYVEQGTSRQAPQPFLAPAATDHTDEYKAILESELKDA